MTEKIDDKLLKNASSQLAMRDSQLRGFIAKHGLPSVRKRPNNFDTLLKIICAQQISTFAARAISDRLDLLASPLTASKYLGLPPEVIGKVGLSKQKIRYGFELATALESGQFSLRKIASMGDEDAIAEMTKIVGIGRWTAEMYLIFALGRPDIWPVGDLGVIKGVMGIKKLEEKPSKELLNYIGDQYRPWRSIAA
ncbi:MAG: DNA-3-methyladenine glycosylase 2 family protein, partial [Pseudomonadota bacterium]|nr:DNA-3-methyladenine glycosylase 2 family protein [Pseudomonadota bacterium]